MEVSPDDIFEYDESIRVVKEVNEHCTDSRIQIIYALYRKQTHWHNKKTEWIYLREGYCSIKTFCRWAKKAIKH